MRFEEIPYLTRAIWAILALAAVFAAVTGHWPTVFISVTAMALTMLPAEVSRRLQIRLPMAFVAAVSVFVFATLFLGEVFDFYERFWWWDAALHGLSAWWLGIIGFLFVLYLFQGDRYAAPPWALALIAFCFALAVGAIWEIFEFSMDQLFGMNMQKSGLQDTMWDLIVDTIGAGLAALTGFFWLKGRTNTLTGMIEEFVTLNRKTFRRVAGRLSRDE